MTNISQQSISKKPAWETETGSEWKKENGPKEGADVFRCHCYHVQHKKVWFSAAVAAAAERVSDGTDLWEKMRRCGEGGGVMGEFVEADEKFNLFHLQLWMRWE